MSEPALIFLLLMTLLYSPFVLMGIAMVIDSIKGQ